MNTASRFAIATSFAFISACSVIPLTGTSTSTGQPEKSGSTGMVLPATTADDDARTHYMTGWTDYENSRFISANKKFRAAADSDPSFAMAHLMAAASSNSTEGFVTSLELATSNKDGTSRGEQLLIETFEHFLANNATGAIATSQQLAMLHPASPRAWVFLGGAHSNVNDADSARAAYKKAIEVDAAHVPGHIGLGNSFLTQEPKDFAMAEEHFKHAVALTPDEPNPYDLLGDAHRAQGNLQAAYADYTKAAELAPNLGSGLQQRGHVNSFLGNYAEARADYARAAELEDARGSNAGPSFRTFGAYVNLHQGNRAAAITELLAIAGGLEGSTMEGADDLRIGALQNVALIAIEDFKTDVARDAIASATAIALRQADALGSDDVRRNANATRAYWEGMLAARTYDAAGADSKANEYERLVASSTNPRKLERMHEILGMSAYRKGDFAGAVEHLDSGNHVNNMYTKYYLARANESAGNSAEAARLYDEMAVYNFNGPGYAMFRKDILARASN